MRAFSRHFDSKVRFERDGHTYCRYFVKLEVTAWEVEHVEIVDANGVYVDPCFLAKPDADQLIKIINEAQAEEQEKVSDYFEWPKDARGWI
jgi:hypothetical protein